MSDQQREHDQGVIHAHVAFAEAAANGSRATAEFLLANGADIDAPGRDGTTPLCAAALWGNDAMVSFLLSHGADPVARNEGSRWTALHAAAFQEHGKVVRILLEHGADPTLPDAEQRTPADFASISEAIWPFFAASGCRKSLKADLIAKGIIRKVADQPELDHAGTTDKDTTISYFSRPGSSYTRAQWQPPTNAGRKTQSPIKRRLAKKKKATTTTAKSSSRPRGTTKMFARRLGRSLMPLRPHARLLSSASEEEAGRQMVRWRKIAKVMIGVTFTLGAVQYVLARGEEEEEEEVPQYAYLKIRNKPYPWKYSDCNLFDFKCKRLAREAEEAMKQAEQAEEASAE